MNIDESVLNGIKIYLSIGVAVTGVLVADHLRKRRSESEWMKEVRDTLYPERKRVWNRFANNLLAPSLAGLAMIALWPVALYIQVSDYLKEKRSTEMPKRGLELGLNHLLEKVTVDEVINRETVIDPLHAAPQLPFGHLNPRWEEFIAGLLPQDELWTFRAEGLNRMFEKELAQGYAVVRGKTVLKHIRI